VDNAGGLEDFLADGQAQSGEAGPGIDKLDSDVAVEKGSETGGELLADESGGPLTRRGGVRH
jgi:hypothetical protein